MAEKCEVIKGKMMGNCDRVSDKSMAERKIFVCNIGAKFYAF